MAVRVVDGMDHSRDMSVFVCRLCITGNFIIWDKMFGTYEPEKDEVVYGITTDLKCWSTLWANTHFWHEMWLGT